MNEQGESVGTGTRRRPSLIRSSGERPDGLFPLVAWYLVRWLEPIGYTSAAAVGLGLWILLDDYLLGLSDTVTLALLIVSAGALWWAAWVLGNYPFAETGRLGNAIYAAAIGTTGWIAWFSTQHALEPDARFTLTSAVVAVCSYLAQRVRGDSVTWTLLVAAVFGMGIAAGITLGGPVEERAAGFAVIGALIAAACLTLLAGREAKVRYETTALIVLVITIPALLSAFGLSSTLAIGAAAAGIGVAMASLLARRPATQLGKIGAAIVATLSILVVLVQVEVQLPIVLIVGGAAVLAALSWAARSVFGASPEIPPDDPESEVAYVPPADTPGGSPGSPGGVDVPAAAATPGVASPKTNGLAIASLILGITWISWVGSLFAVVLGHVALNQIDNSKGTQSGRALAVAGLVLGYLALGFGALVLAWRVGRGFWFQM